MAIWRARAASRARRGRHRAVEPFAAMSVVRLSEGATEHSSGAHLVQGVARGQRIVPHAVREQRLVPRGAGLTG
jgi:hypothetical protein